MNITDRLTSEEIEEYRNAVIRYLAACELGIDVVAHEDRVRDLEREFSDRITAIDLWKQVLIDLTENKSG